MKKIILFLLLSVSVFGQLNFKIIYSDPEEGKEIRETAGSFDLDSELKFWLSGLGEFGISFSRGTDVRELITLINNSMTY